MSSAWASGVHTTLRGRSLWPNPGRSKTMTLVVFGRKIDQTAGFEILDHAAVAVKKNQRLARAPFNIVQPNAIRHRGSGRQPDCHAPPSSQDDD